MDIAKDGTITSPVDDIPGLSFRREERGCAKGGGILSPKWTGRHSKGAQVKSRRKMMMPFHARLQILYTRAQPSANGAISRHAFKQVSQLGLSES